MVLQVLVPYLIFMIIPLMPGRAVLGHILSLSTHNSYGGHQAHAQHGRSYKS
jgi:hypothetical protein